MFFINVEWFYEEKQNKYIRLITLTDIFSNNDIKSFSITFPYWYNKNIANNVVNKIREICDECNIKFTYNFEK